MAGPLQLARLVSSGDHLTLHYNPSSVVLTKTSKWQPVPTRNARKAPEQEFVGTDPRTLTLTALLDSVDTTTRSSQSSDANGAAPVDKAIEKLLGWTCATKESYDKGKPQPELVHLQWGEHNWFTGYLKSVEARYSMFDPDGKPVRATVTLIIEETPEDAKRQNPTSGGVAGRRSAVLGAGETLAAVAYREYGDAALWRALAAANDVDDPARVPAGRALLVPPVSEARRLSGAGRA